MSAVLLGSGLGLGLGAAYLAAGITGHTAQSGEEQRMAQAAVAGYAGARLAAREPVAAPGTPLRIGGLTFDTPRPAAKAKKRGDLECLTQAVYYEARGESPRGQFAVAQVVMNRVKHPAFPKSVCAVVFQGAGRRGCQFSFACDGSMRGGRESEAWARARRVATRALAGAALADVGSATHFHTTGVSPLWAPQMLRVSQVGVHVFYRFSPRKLRVGPAPPQLEQAVLTSQPTGEIPEIDLTPTMSAAVEASLENAPGAAPPAPPLDAKVKADQAPVAPAAKPAEAALLIAAPAVSAAAS